MKILYLEFYKYVEYLGQLGLLFAISNFIDVTLHFTYNATLQMNLMNA